jgi:tRNA-specific 2-thiouridylase
MKALALLSGGLDSTLATKIMQDLGVELIAFNTISPFCLCNHRSGQGCFHGAAVVARELNLRMIAVNVAAEFLAIVKNPAHGYGSNMNPCIDCRILLFKKAKETMLKEGAAFIVTGEVVGQRPMSQKINTMRHIEKEAQVEGLVVRPLSAKILKPTIAEEQGWIIRDKLLDINGRGRTQQIALAKKLGINDYPCPAGGCLLTDPSFSKRLKDQLQYGELNSNEVELLKVGRHFRLSPSFKLIVGRNENENKRLVTLATQEDMCFEPKEVPGPTGLGRGVFNQDIKTIASRIIARYISANGVDLKIALRKIPQLQEEIITVAALKEPELKALII